MRIRCWIVPVLVSPTAPESKCLQKAESLSHVTILPPALKNNLRDNRWARLYSFCKQYCTVSFIHISSNKFIINPSIYMDLDYLRCVKIYKKKYLHKLLKIRNYCSKHFLEMSWDYFNEQIAEALSYRYRLSIPLV